MLLDCVAVRINFWNYLQYEEIEVGNLLPLESLCYGTDQLQALPSIISSGVWQKAVLMNCWTSENSTSDSSSWGLLFTKVWSLSYCYFQMQIFISVSFMQGLQAIAHFQTLGLVISLCTIVLQSELHMF